MNKQFAKAIEQEAAHNDYNIADASAENSGDDGKPALSEQKRKELQAKWNEEEAARKRQFKEQHGFAVGGGRSFLYAPKDQAVYGLWKEIVPFFIGGMFLDYKPAQLAAKFNEISDFTVTASMMHDKLGQNAIRALEKMLKDSGIDMRLGKAVTIRSVQKQFLARKEAETSPSEKGTLRWEITGGYAKINGKAYRIEKNDKGNRYVRINRKRLPLDVLTEIRAGN